MSELLEKRVSTGFSSGGFWSACSGRGSARGTLLSGCELLAHCAGAGVSGASFMTGGSFEPAAACLSSSLRRPSPASPGAGASAPSLTLTTCMNSAGLIFHCMASYVAGVQVAIRESTRETSL